MKHSIIGKNKHNRLVPIAEIKRKLPSKGHIGYIPNPGLLLRAYYQRGAAAISVLTDKEGFGCSIVDLKQVVDEQGSHPNACPRMIKK